VAVLSRIPLPFSVDEFRVGHVYMVVRTGSEGRSTGTEVVTLEARPFEDAKRGLRGIYRVREFHMEGLPSWARKLLPQNALNIEEKTWDCYPYIKTGTLFLLLSSSSGAPLTLLPLANSDLAFSLLVSAIGPETQHNRLHSIHR